MEASNSLVRFPMHYYMMSLVSELHVKENYAHFYLFNRYAVVDKSIIFCL